MNVNPKTIKQFFSRSSTVRGTMQTESNNQKACSQGGLSRLLQRMCHDLMKNEKQKRANKKYAGL